LSHKEKFKMNNLAEHVNDNELGDIFQQPSDKLSDKPTRLAPQNLQAEQALLGAIFCNNNALNHTETLKPEHFYELMHQRIFKAILHFHNQGKSANHVTLKPYFAQAGENIGGEYLAKLAIAAVTVINVREYAAMLIDLHTKRQLIELAEGLINQVCNVKIEVDAIHLLEQTEQKLFNLAETGSTTKTLETFKVFGLQAVQMAERAHQHKGEVVGVSTGLDGLDKLLGGLQNSDLLILAGRPSMGKTALATTIAFKAAMRFKVEAGDAKPQSVAFFSLEMSSEQLATRVLAGEADLNSSSIMRGRLSDNQMLNLIEKNAAISDIPLLIDDTPALSISALRTRARRFKRTHNIGLIIVDYLQLLTTTKSNNFNRVQEVSEITQALKALAKELNVPVIALSQLSRAVETRDDKRPQLSDLRESGSIEQDADVVMFVYREQYYLERIEPAENSSKHGEWKARMEVVTGKADIIIAKQRHGAIGNVTLRFEGDKARFSDCA
jgi:replicative DNA helicase